MNSTYRKVAYWLGHNLVLKTIKFKPKKLDLPTDAKSFYDIEVNAASGDTISLSKYKGKKVLIVNIATECAYGEQYDMLEELYQERKEDMVILGFPSNSFAQEPVKDSKMESACRINFGVSFPLFKKGPVRGSKQNDLYNWLTDKTQNGWNSLAPRWNFYKYLVDENGVLQAVYSSGVEPKSKKILSLLK